MAIHNINTLANSDLLDHLKSGDTDYISKYYNEALANLGQRNTKEDILGYESFSLLNILEVLIDNTEIENLKSIIKSNKTWIELVYCIDGDKKYIQLNTKDNSQVYILSTDLSLETNEDDHIKVIRKNGQDNDSVLTNYKIDIFTKLFDKIFENELQDKSSSNEIEKFKCYISTEYNIYILKNGINETIIYGSYNPIYVHFALNSNNEQDINLINDAINIVSNLSYIKFSLYAFEFDYENDENNPDIIYTKYDLPYIDKSNEDNLYKWFINGANTHINAEAKEAMNLNIIVCYQYQSDGLKILSGLNEYYNKDSIDKEQIQNVKINWITGDIVYGSFNLPMIKASMDEKTKQYIQNSLVFQISKINSLGLPSKYLTNTKHLLDNGCLTSLWRYNKDNKSWEPLTLINDGPILDFNEITNFNNLLEYKISQIHQIEPDNFLFSQLIFDEVLKTNKHDDQNQFLYPVLQNINGNEYDNRYINNLNFSLRYINNIEGEIGQNIVKVNNTLSAPFLNINNIETNSNRSVTNSIYKYTLNNRTNYYNEYIPNYNIPLFDMSEFLVKDSNIINRQNILIFDSTGNTYYSYIGTSFDEFNKNTLHIGTSSTNINLGEYSLTTSSDKQNFKKQNILSLDFDNTYINGNNLKVNASSYMNAKTHFNDLRWDIRTFNNLGNDKNIYSISLSLPFNYYLYNSQYYAIMDLVNINLKNLYNDIKSNINRNKNELYVNMILSVNHDGIIYYYKYNDLLIIDKLLRYLGINNINNRIKVYSNTNDIIYINDNGINKPVFMISSGNMLSQYINITDSSENGMSININQIPSSFFGNTLDINIVGDIYGNNNETLEMTINESHVNTLKSIWQIPLNY